MKNKTRPGSNVLLGIAIVLLVAALAIIFLQISSHSKSSPSPSQAGHDEPSGKLDGPPGGTGETGETGETAQGAHTPIMVRTIDGEMIDLSSGEHKAIILDFWATHCPPCREERPWFDELYHEFKDEGVIIVGISLDRGGESQVRPFLRDNNITFPIGFPTEEIMSKYGQGMQYIPTTYIIDSQGKVRERVVGAKEKSFWRDWIEKLLLEASESIENVA